MNRRQGYSRVHGWGFERRARKPAGGSCFISSTSLLAAWEAYHGEKIRLVDLRVWFGCFELVARRCGLQNGRYAQYSFDELERVVGDRRAAGAVRRLERQGFLRWRSDGIDLTMAEPDGAAGGVLRRRPVPVPRRLIRCIARGTSRAMLATILGHLLTCLWYRQGQCVSGGRCKASWIARHFGVDLRNVKAARQRLLALGWLESVPSDQLTLNRWGLGIVWTMGFHVKHNASSPPAVANAQRTPPPLLEKELSSRAEQRTGACRISDRTGSENGRALSALRPPTLRDVRPADLSDDARLARLLEQAMARGWVNGSECDRLRVYGAAEHARACGQSNPPGLFVWMLKHQRWDFISQQDEDRARMRLHREGSAHALHPIVALCTAVVDRLGRRSVAGARDAVCHSEWSGQPGLDAEVRISGVAYANWPEKPHS